MNSAAVHIFLDWLPQWSIFLSLAILAVFGFWQARYPPFKPCEKVGPVPNALLIPIILIGLLILALGVSQLVGDMQISRWWGGWLGLVLASLGVLSVVIFGRIKEYYPKMMIGVIIALTGIAVLTTILWWFWFVWWLLLILLLMLILYLIWICSIILVCASKPPRPPVAPPVRRCTLVNGPTYTPNGVVPVVPAGAGRESASFSLAATFADNPAAGDIPSCCEVRQFIRWDAAAAASFTAIRGPGIIVPHNGFPANHPHDTWIEDRGATDLRYGYRSGPHVINVAGGDQYLNAAGAADIANGVRYTGRDQPGGPVALAGQWRFELRVVDTCTNRNLAVVAAVTINW